MDLLEIQASTWAMSSRSFLDGPAIISKPVQPIPFGFDLVELRTQV